jgi:Ca2+-dependent lipid-binding protein
MSKELGTLVIVVLKAKNLHDRHSFYKQDPYAKVTLNGNTQKTNADVKGGQHPEWDAEFRFPVYASKNDSSRKLEVTGWRVESKGDEEIGKGQVDISDTLKSGEFDGEFEIAFRPLCLV